MPCAPTTARCAAHGWMQTAVSSTAAACAFGGMARKSSAIHWTSPAPPPPHNGRWPRRSKPLPPTPGALAGTRPQTMTNRSTARWSWASSGSVVSKPAAYPIRCWCQVRHRLLTASGCWPTRARFAKTPSASGMVHEAPHRTRAICSRSMPWPKGTGGWEQRNGSALTCGRADLPRRQESRASEGYTTLLRLISHEYFHTWNVKRLRPAEFASYDYSRENYTELLWFFEGFTSYYDDLLLRRAGLIDDATYLRLLGKAINQLLQTPGRTLQTVAQASFDAWVKYYRQDENTANATVSYYTKGALVALCLDLT